MLILIMAATEMEINDFLLTKLSQLKKDVQIEVLISGIGVPATTYHLTKAVTLKKYDYVIQAGIAGTFSKHLHNGDVVLVNKDTFADIGINENNKFKTIFESGLNDSNIFPFENGWLNNNTSILDEIKLKKVKAITINTINDSREHFDLLKNKFDADIETMEGAALHYVCLQNDQPFIQLRSISNEVGERDKKKWDMKNSLVNLNKQLYDVIKSISKTVN